MMLLVLSATELAMEATMALTCGHKVGVSRCTATLAKARKVAIGAGLVV